jgi:hypothetical protein
VLPRSPSGPRPAVAAHRSRTSDMSLSAGLARLDGCDRDGRRRTGGDRQGARGPWKPPAAGEETASEFFSERQDSGGGDGCPPSHIIHPIAIRKTVTAPEGSGEGAMAAPASHQ